MTIAAAAVVAVLCVMLRNRPDLLASISIAVAIAFPYRLFSQVFVFGTIHPAAIIAIGGIVVVTLFHPHQVSAGVADNIFVNLALAVFVASVAIATFAVGGGSGVAYFVDQIVTPLALFALCSAAATLVTDAGRWLKRTVFAMAVLEALLTIAQFVAGVPFPFVAVTLSEQSSESTSLVRWNGTLDHPLALGLLLATAIYMLPFVRRLTIRVAFGALFLVAILAAQSRTALLAGLFGLVIVVLLSRAGVIERAFWIVAILATSGALFALVQTLPIYQRFLNDRGSGLARTDAYASFADQVLNFLWLGGGANAAGQAAAQSGLTTSFENPFIIFAINFGLVGALAYFGAQAMMIIRGFTSLRDRWLLAPALVAAILVQTYSSLATESAAAMILWGTIGLVGIGVRAQRSEKLREGSFVENVR